MKYFGQKSWRLYFTVLIVLSLVSFHSFSQIGGRNSFDFINIPNTARLAAMGGINVSLADRDVNFFSSNPALVSDSLKSFASVNYQFYVADIGHAFLSYAHPFPKWGTITFGVQHLNYKTIQGYDANGIETAEYAAGETAFLVGKSHQISNFRMGATLKGIFSSIAGYHASGIMMDIGGVFLHPNQRLSVGMTIKNLGLIISNYSRSNSSTLPFDVQVGATLKPEHMPLRFSLAAFNLTRPDATYYNAVANEEKPGVAKRIFSHVNVGTEILIHKNVNIMLGYNYLVHQALRLSTGGGGAGVSLGFSVAIKSMEFVASRNAMVAGNAGYSFTLSTNANKLLKRRS